MTRLQGEPPKRPSKKRRMYYKDKKAANERLREAAKRLKKNGNN